MATQSKLTSQGQISVPADIRRKLGIGPGSAIEWVVENDHVFVRKAGKHTSVEVHEALFPEDAPKPSTTSSSTKEGVRKYIRNKHARR